MITRIRTAAATGCSLMLLAGCDDASAPPTTVFVNTPPADGGQMVLLTVMVAAAFLAVAIAVGFAWAWAQERRTRQDADRARREAEDAVLALTGQSIDRVRLAIRQRPSSWSRDPGTRAAHDSRRQIEGWRE